MLTLVGMALAVSTIAAAAMRSSGPRVVLSSPDTIAVGDTVTVSATAFDASGHRVPGAHIVWQVNPTTAVVLPDSNGQTARLTDTVPSAYTELIATWVDSTFTPPLSFSSTGRVASAARVLVATPAILQPPVASVAPTHLSIYGAITLDPSKGLVVDSTSFLRMTVGDTLKSCLHIVAWTADNKPVTGLPVHLHVGDTTVLKFTVPADSLKACPDTTVDPAAVARSAGPASSLSTRLGSHRSA